MVSVTAANNRPVQATSDGLEWEWKVTFAIDGEEAHFKVDFTVIAGDPLISERKARGKLRLLLQEAAQST